MTMHVATESPRHCLGLGAQVLGLGFGKADGAGPAVEVELTGHPRAKSVASFGFSVMFSAAPISAQDVAAPARRMSATTHQRP
jgi:hypothetical protein